MSKSLQRALPVLASIAVILLVALLRSRSKTLAAITATMPLNVPLALWITYVADDTDQATVIDFTGAMLVGLGASAVWLIAAHLGARAGWGLVRMVVLGYLAWGLTLASLFFLQPLLGGTPLFPR